MTQTSISNDNGFGLFKTTNHPQVPQNAVCPHSSQKYETIRSLMWIAGV